MGEARSATIVGRVYSPAERQRWKEPDLVRCGNQTALRVDGRPIAFSCTSGHQQLSYYISGSASDGVNRAVITRVTVSAVWRKVVRSSPVSHEVLGSLLAVANIKVISSLFVTETALNFIPACYSSVSLSSRPTFSALPPYCDLRPGLRV
eukprot:g96.t1